MSSPSSSETSFYSRVPMSDMVSLLVMSTLLGGASFAAGILPLSWNFSKLHLNMCSTLGTGLLLGAALGVIIPEGIETIAASHPTSELPTSKIALSLLIGFSFMLVVERLVSPHDHETDHLPLNNIKANSSIAFDAERELSRLEEEQGITHSQAVFDRPQIAVAYPLTLGLIVHGLADGLALGVSSISTASNDSSDLSLVVFFALAIHKAPTALALTMSLMSTSLTRTQCKKHLAVFSASTPFGALISYAFLSFLGATGGQNNDWTGVALLISGGTFLYVATVVRPVAHGVSDSIAEPKRVSIIVFGMFLPWMMGSIVGVGHSHGGNHTP